MKTQILSVNICVKLPMAQARKLLFSIDYDEIAAALKDLDVDRINYDGHFGPRFFCACQEKDIPEIERRLAKLVKKRG